MVALFSSTSPPRLFQYALACILFGALSYRNIWTGAPGGSEPEHRQLAFLDEATVGPNYRGLVHPSLIDSDINKRMPTLESKDDDSCDDILLYMPHEFANSGHASQLNNYLHAAMMATLMNKAMVVLEFPWRNSHGPIGGMSQFGTPKDYDKNPKSFPNGLLRLINPPDWLTRKCPLPCQASYNYGDDESQYYQAWEKHIVTTAQLGAALATHSIIKDFSSVEDNNIQCQNDNGRQVKVLPVGPRDIRGYSKAQFQEFGWPNPNMNNALPPSPRKDWALRLGAKPHEAEIFSALKENRDIWDYISALMGRSSIVQFQPWIERDLEAYINTASLPLDVSYDGIHIRRGDKLRFEAKSGVKKYWDSVQETDPDAVRTNFIPLRHYLSQYDDLKCSDEPRLVFIASDSPAQVKQEIDELPKDQDGNSITNDECHKFQFIFTPAANDADMTSGGFHLHRDRTGPAHKYTKNIASVADLMIMAKSDMFIGEYNSNWGRFLRVFRLRLNDDGTLDRTKDVKVAWGNTDPGIIGL